MLHFMSYRGLCVYSKSLAHSTVNKHAHVKGRIKNIYCNHWMTVYVIYNELKLPSFKGKYFFELYKAIYVCLPFLWAGTQWGL